VGSFLKPYFYLACFFLIVWTISSAYAQNDSRYITLDECIQTALQMDTDLLYTINKTFGSDERIRQMNRKLWPSISLYCTDNTSIEESSEFSQYDPSTGQSFVPGEGFQTGANLLYSIYDSGSRRSSLNYEKNNRQILNIDAKQLKRNVVKQTIQSYMTILERNAELVVRQEQINQAEQALKIAEKRLAQGSGIQYDVLLEDAYLSQSRADLLSAQYSARQATRSLLLLLKMDTSKPLNPEPLKQTEPVELSTQEIISITLENRLEFQRTIIEIDSAKLQLKLLKATRRPTLDLILSYSQQGSDISKLSDGDIIWSAGLSFKFSPFADTGINGSSTREWINSKQFMQKSNLSFNINDGSSLLNQEMDQRILLAKLQEEFVSLKDKISNEVLEAYEIYRLNLVRLSAQEKNELAMQENHRIQQKRYELGLNQYKDVVDARAELVSARIKLTQTLYTTEHSRMNLDYSLGLLNYQEQ